MKAVFFVASSAIVFGLSLSTASGGTDNSTTFDDKQPPLPQPHPPQTPLFFKRVDKVNREVLEILYPEPGRMTFKFSINGPCQRVETGTATIKPYWWLGAETDENSRGEEISVQEYIYDRNGNCPIYIRIDENDWTQASIMEAPDCNKGCASSGQPLQRKKGKR